MMSSCATAAPGSKSTATIQHNATTSSSIQQQQHQQKHSQNHTTSSQATAYHTSITLTNNNSSNTKSAAKQSEHMEHSSSSQYHGKKNFFTKAVPTMPRPLAILCLILNIVLPGLGTLVSSFAVVFGASHSYDSMTRAFFVNLLAFALQLGSAIIILGWVWSIKYGFLFVQLSGQCFYNISISSHFDKRFVCSNMFVAVHRQRHIEWRRERAGLAANVSSAPQQYRVNQSVQREAQDEVEQYDCCCCLRRGRIEIVSLFKCTKANHYQQHRALKCYTLKVF